MEEEDVKIEDPKKIDLPLHNRIADTMWDHYTILRYQLDLEDSEDSDIEYIALDVDLDLDNSDGQYM
jgi:hypothetical protein